MPGVAAVTIPGALHEPLTVHVGRRGMPLGYEPLFAYLPPDDPLLRSPAQIPPPLPAAPWPRRTRR